MVAGNVTDTLRVLLPDELALLDAHAAGDVLRTVKACRGFLDAYEARLTRHITALHAAGASAPWTPWLTRWHDVGMVDRRVGDWRNGVDIDEELADWDRTTRRAQIVVAIGLVVAAVFLVGFALSGTPQGVEYMAGAMVFMVLFAALLLALRRRFTSAVSTFGGPKQPTATDGDQLVER